MFTKLKVHIWGGLGSQLFGLAFILELRKLGFTPERMCVVFHEGGVTKRNIEIEEFLPSNLQRKIVKDFESNSLDNSKNYFKKILFYVIRKILLVSKIVIEANSNREKIMPWTLSCRGHYRFRFIEPEIIRSIFNRVVGSLTNEKVFGISELVIHYRLGDLIGLKPTLSSNQVIALAKENLWDGIERIRIFVEDPKDLCDFPSVIDDIAVTIDSAQVNQVIESGVMSYLFIGTDSKISIWIALFRLHRTPESHIKMPLSSKQGLEIILGSLILFPNLKFY